MKIKQILISLIGFGTQGQNQGLGNQGQGVRDEEIVTNPDGSKNIVEHDTIVNPNGSEDIRTDEIITNPGDEFFQQKVEVFLCLSIFLLSLTNKTSFFNFLL